MPEAPEPPVVSNVWYSRLPLGSLRRGEGSFVSTRRAFVNGNSFTTLPSCRASLSSSHLRGAPQLPLPCNWEFIPPSGSQMRNAESLPPSPPCSARMHARAHVHTHTHTHSHSHSGRKAGESCSDKCLNFHFPTAALSPGHCLAPPVVMSLVNYILY